VLLFIKQDIRKEEGMIIYSTYKNNYPVTPPQVVTVIDLGYLRVQTNFPEQISSHYHIKRREIASS
jgi:hypothetical protein